jgi:hypothetical protein
VKNSQQGLHDDWEQVRLETCPVPLRVTGRHHPLIADKAGVPQIAAGLLRRSARQSRAKTRERGQQMLDNSVGQKLP